MKINQIKLIVWYMIEIFSVSVFSFLGAICLSLIAVSTILGVYAPGEGTEFEMDLIIMLLLLIVIPSWAIIVIISSIYARLKFTGKQAFIKRVMFYLIVPIVVTPTLSGIVATILFSYMYSYTPI